MTAIAIWIFLPALLSAFLFLFRYQRNLVVGVATAACVLMAFVALLLPIGEIVQIGPVTFTIPALLNFFGRRIMITNAERPMLVLLYTMGAFWFFGSSLVQVNRLFVPIGLLILSISVAALSVEPFLYSAILIEVIVLLTVLIAAPPGTRQRSGVMRYLIFLTMGMPFILLAGWAAVRVETNMADKALLTQTVSLMVVGFMFWLAIFPFNAWVNQMVKQVQAYVAGFILTILSTTVLFLLLDFINAYTWLRDMPGFSLGLLIVGLIIMLTSSLATLTRSDLPRLLALVFAFNNGLALVTLAGMTRSSYLAFLSLFPIRLLIIALFTLCLAIMQRDEENGEDIRHEKLAASPNFLVLAGVMVAIVSTVGLPFFGNFPILIYTVQQVAKVRLLFAGLLLMSCVLVLGGGLRTITDLTRISSDSRVKTSYREIILISVGALLLVLIGTWPRFVLPLLYVLLRSYPMLN